MDAAVEFLRKNGQAKAEKKLEESLQKVLLRQLLKMTKLLQS